MKILIINGSPRKKGYSKALAEFVLNYAEEKKYDVELLDLSKDEVEPFKGYEGSYSEKTKEIVDSLENYDVFIICSPVYDGSFSSTLKNLFEHANFKKLIGRTAGFIIMAGGKISYVQVQGHLNSLMNYFTIISNPKAAHVGPKDFDEEMNLTDEKIIERIKEVVDETLEMKK